MNVTLTRQLEAFVKERVESGSNADASDVVREALQLLIEREQLDRLQQSLIESEEQIKRGESRPWTPELMQSLIAEADELYRQGVRAGQDVRP